MSMKHAVKTLRDEIWDALDLNNRSITFHLADCPFGSMCVGSGIADSADDLYESGAMDEIFEENDGEPNIPVYWVESFLLGEGEVDHADWDDVDYLRALAMESPNTLIGVMDEYADSLVTLSDCILENPWNE